MTLRTPLSVAAVTLALVGTLTACTATERDPSALPAATPTASPAGPDSGGAATDPLAERDQFFRDQQFPADGSALTAVTPAQQDFIAQQRSYLEAQGATWSPNFETVYLALTADACETSILNGHEIDTARFSTHVQSSPLVTTLTQNLSGDQRDTGVRNLASIMVFGTGFLCPADADQWQAAYTEVYG